MKDPAINDFSILIREPYAFQESFGGDGVCGDFDDHGIKFAIGDQELMCEERDKMTLMAKILLNERCGKNNMTVRERKRKRSRISENIKSRSFAGKSKK